MELKDFKPKNNKSDYTPEELIWLQQEDRSFTQRPASLKSLCKRKLLYGIGVNDAWYITDYKVNGKRIACPYYKSWGRMLERCYSNNFQHTNPTYKGCTVEPSWLVFSTFREWMSIQDWLGKQLDKDILITGNKTYSAETCLFVSAEVNTLLNTNSINKGKYPTGVTITRGGKYMARCNINDNFSEYLGTYSSILEAETAYKTFKAARIKEVANTQEDGKLKEALYRKAKELLE